MSKAFESLDTVWCPVADMALAVAFYRDQLGLTPSYESEYWTSFPLGNGIQLGLHGGGGGAGGGFVVGFLTSDIIALRDRLNAAGVTTEGFHDIPRGVVMNIQDPDGNRLQATQLGIKASDLA